MEQQEDVFIRLNKLPEDLVNYIYEYIPKNVLKYTNKQLFEREYITFISDVRGISHINKAYNFKLDSYLRFVIRNDFDYLFKLVYNLNFYMWQKTKKWRYKNVYFDSILDYMTHITRYQYKSKKCINYIMNEKNNKCVRYVNKKISNNNNKRWRK
jgi:hypothetical protein